MKEECLINVMNFLKSFFKSKKQDIDTFYSMLNQSEWKDFIGKDEVKMIKGVIEVSELEVKDIMIPRSNMILLEASHNFDELLRIIIESGHSRFPVIADNKDEVIGILLAKDLLKFSKDGEDSFEMDSFLRPATFIPESKRLKILLKEFRKSRNHIAIVVDEYGRTAGLLTIEDLLEQIVGDIEDEYDVEDTPLIKEVKKNKYIDEVTKKKINGETLRLLELQKDSMVKFLMKIPKLYYTKSHFPIEISQRAFDHLWRVCESYEMWCKETKQKQLIQLNVLD